MRSVSLLLVFSGAALNGGPAAAQTIKAPPPPVSIEQRPLAPLAPPGPPLSETVESPLPPELGGLDAGGRHVPTPEEIAETERLNAKVLAADAERAAGNEAAARQAAADRAVYEAEVAAVRAENERIARENAEAQARYETAMADYRVRACAAGQAEHCAPQPSPK
jgi:type IV secretory pathway VirB10-like protein